MAKCCGVREPVTLLHTFTCLKCFTIARSEFPTHILRDLLRNEKFAKGNLFEADFRQEEVTDM